MTDLGSWRRGKYRRELTATKSRTEQSWGSMRGLADKSVIVPADASARFSPAELGIPGAEAEEVDSWMEAPGWPISKRLIGRKHLKFWGGHEEASSRSRGLQGLAGSLRT